MPQTPTSQVDIDLYLHVRVLIGIILGLSVTRLVGGVAGFIQHPERYQVSLIHLGWVAWALLAFLALCAIAAKTRNLAFHSMFVVIWLVYEVSFFSRHYFTLT